VTGSSSFEYTALRRDGSRESGVIEAVSRAAAIAAVTSSGAFPTRVAAAPDALWSSPKASTTDLAQGLRALATLLNSGIPLARALTILPDLVPRSWHAVLPTLRHRIEQGEPLSAVLQSPLLGTPPHVIGLVAAGESGSGLGAAVEEAASLLEARVAERTALRNALAYPSLLAISGGASVALLVGVVLPRFAALLQDVGQTLPLSTRIVLTLGDAARVGTLPVLVVTFALFVTWRRWISSATGQTQWHEWLLRAPVIGAVRLSMAVAHACSVLGALVRAGVPLATALPHAAAACGDRAVERRLLAARSRIAKGERLATALAAESAFTAPAIRLIRVGEETGALGAMFLRSSHVEAERALHAVTRLVRIIEPAMILCFGGVVLLVAAALLQAMYGLRPPL